MATRLATQPMRLADLRGHCSCSAYVPLRVDLRHVGLGVPEQDLRSFQSELLADSGRVVVPQAVPR